MVTRRDGSGWMYHARMGWRHGMYVSRRCHRNHSCLEKQYALPCDPNQDLATAASCTELHKQAARSAHQYAHFFRRDDTVMFVFYCQQRSIHDTEARHANSNAMCSLAFFSRQGASRMFVTRTHARFCSRLSWRLSTAMLRRTLTVRTHILSGRLE